jgi:hypothetical protein
MFACTRTENAQLFQDVPKDEANKLLGSSFQGSTPVAFGNRTMRNVRYNAKVDWKALWSWNDGTVINLRELE